MKRNLFPLILGLWILAASTIAGQESGHVGQLPDSLYGFTLTESSTLRGTAGRAFRYQNRDKVLADAFVYAVPPDRLHLSDSLQLAAETNVYIAGLAYGIDRGRYDAYEVPVNTTVTVDSKPGTIVPGRAVVMVFRRADESFVSFMHLFVREGEYLKVRLTLPAAEWQTSMAPNFALELAKRLFP